MRWVDGGKFRFVDVLKSSQTRSLYGLSEVAQGRGQPRNRVRD